MSIDLKFVELTAIVLKILFIKYISMFVVVRTFFHQFFKTRGLRHYLHFAWKLPWKQSKLWKLP